MDKKLLNSLASQRQDYDTVEKLEVLESGYHQLTIVSNPNDDSQDVDDFKTRLREKKVQALKRQQIQEAQKVLKTKIKIDQSKIK